MKFYVIAPAGWNYLVQKNDIQCNEVMSPEQKEKQTTEPTKFELKL